MSKARDISNIGTTLSTVSTTELGYVDGVTSAIQTQIDAKAPSSTAATLTGTQTLTNKQLNSPMVVAPSEYGQQLGAAGGALTLDTNNGAFFFYTGTTTANFTLNIRGDSSNTLASTLAVGESITISLVVNNTTAYYLTSAPTIDGTATGVTTKWSGGTAPASGNASSNDIYSFTIWKTAATPAYTVFAAGPIKYA